MGGKGGNTPCPSKKTPEKQTLHCSRPPLRTLRGDERSETKPSGFGHREQKVPAGLHQAVLPVLPRAFQSDRIPNPYGLWQSLATSIVDLVRDLGGNLGRAPPLSWEGAKGRVRGAQPRLAVLTVLRWMDTGCVVQVFQVQVRDTSYLCKEGTKPPHSAGQVAEGRQQVLRGRQPICKYPVSFPAYYAM